MQGAVILGMCALVARKSWRCLSKCCGWDSRRRRRRVRSSSGYYRRQHRRTPLRRGFDDTISDDDDDDELGWESDGVGGSAQSREQNVPLRASRTRRPRPV